MTEAQREVAAEIAAGPRGEVRDRSSPSCIIPSSHAACSSSASSCAGEASFQLAWWSWRPDHGAALDLPARVGHSREARRKAGLDGAIVEAIAEGREPRVCRRGNGRLRFLSRGPPGGRVGDAAFAAVRDRFGLDGALELLALSGYYSLMAMVLNTAGLPSPTTQRRRSGPCHEVMRCDAHFTSSDPPSAIPRATRSCATRRRSRLSRTIGGWPVSWASSASSSCSRAPMGATTAACWMQCRRPRIPRHCGRGRNAPDAELARLHKAGVRGVRINVSPIHPPEADSPRRCCRASSGSSALRRARLHLDFLLPGWLTNELLDRLKTLKVDFTLAHMGMFLAKDGVAQSGFQRLLGLLRNGDGRCWSSSPGFTASRRPPVLPMPHRWHAPCSRRRPIACSGQRLSAPVVADKVGAAELFSLLGSWAADDATRQAVLVGNPARLFGF